MAIFEVKSTRRTGKIPEDQGDKPEVQVNIKKGVAHDLRSYACQGSGSRGHEWDSIALKLPIFLNYLYVRKLSITYIGEGGYKSDGLRIRRKKEL